MGVLLGIPHVGLIDSSAGQRAGGCPHSWGHGSLGFSSLSRGGSGQEGRVRGAKEGAVQDPSSFLSELGGRLHVGFSRTRYGVRDHVPGDEDVVSFLRRPQL